MYIKNDMPFVDDYNEIADEQQVDCSHQQRIQD